jgi:glyoxylase-like metal-dependent hydrolase (beta-lactamase superfamily II)
MNDTARITEIGKEFYQIRSPEKDFHRNIYLKRFIGADGSMIPMIFDPGTRLDLKYLLPFLQEKIGGMENLKLIFLSHQDPDLSANLSLIMSNAPQSQLVTSIDTWRLVKMYGVPEKRSKTIESFHSDEMLVRKTQHKIRFVPARYCHFRGSMMVYDYESRVLFSGDLFGGVNTKPEGGIYATEDSWEGISLFHQLYMPSTVALRQTMEIISLLHPFPEIIAPQHGDIVAGENVYTFLERLSQLTVGAELASQADLQKGQALLAINNFFSYLQEHCKPAWKIFSRGFQKGKHIFTPFILVNGQATELKVSPSVTFQQIIHVLNTSPEAQSYPDLRSIFLDIINETGLEFHWLEDEE